MIKINDIQLVHLLVVWYLVNLQDARCNNKGNYCTNTFNKFFKNSGNFWVPPHTYVHTYIYTGTSAPRTCLCEDHDDHQVNDSSCDGCEDLSMLFQELFSTTIDDSYNRYAIYYCSQNSSHHNDHLHCNHVPLNVCASDSHLVYKYEIFPGDLEKVNMVFSQ